MKASPKIRIDQLLVERGLAESRERAQRLVRAGIVVVGDQRIDKPGTRVSADADVRLKGGDPCPYVSRGGLKLEGALKRFGMTDLSGKIALDVGASTGGFSDCLLQHGAEKVWAVDTGRGQIHEKLRQDPRVSLIENANARNLEPAWFNDTKFDLIAVDVSFISLRLIMTPLKAVLRQVGRVLALIKPQFEAGAAELGAGGIVRERSVHVRVLNELLTFFQQGGWSVHGLIPSPVPGATGNVEFFVLLSHDFAPALSLENQQLAIEQVVDESYTFLNGSPRGESSPPAPSPAAPPEGHDT